MQFDVRVNGYAVAEPATVNGYVDYTIIIVDPCMDAIVSYPGLLQVNK